MEFLRRWLDDPIVGQVAVAILGLLIIVVLVRMGRRTLTRYVDDPTARYQARKLVTFGGYLLMVLLLSLIFRARLGGLTVVFGVIGAGIAFALREVILSVAGWLTITIGGLYSAGDRIQLAGTRGDVIDVSILRTTLMEIAEWVGADLYSGRIVRIANSFVYQAPVYNYSRDFPFIWDEIRVPVRHGCDHNLARQTLLRIAEEVVGEYTVGARTEWERMLRRFRVEPARVDPMVTLIVTDNWLEFTVRYVVDYKKRRGVQDELFMRTLDEFAATEGRVSIASETHEIVAFPDLAVRMAERPGHQRADEGKTE